MKHTPESVREQISALADDRLHGDEFAQVIDQLGSDTALRAAWRDYHLVGDVLRASRPAACSDSAAFLSRFQQRLAAEPALPQAAAAVAVSAVVRPLPVPARRPVEAANEPVFRWKLVAGAASLAAAAAIGWNWVGSGIVTVPTGAQMAQQQVQPAQPALPSDSANSVLTAMQPGNTAANGPMAATRVVVGSGNPQVMLRDPRLDQLLEAHRQAAGGAQMPSGFLRNATFENSAR